MIAVEAGMAATQGKWPLVLEGVDFVSRMESEPAVKELLLVVYGVAVVVVEVDVIEVVVVVVVVVAMAVAVVVAVAIGEGSECPERQQELPPLWLHPIAPAWVSSARRR